MQRPGGEREHAGMRPKTISPGWSGEGMRRNQERQERFWGQVLGGGGGASQDAQRATASTSPNQGPQGCWKEP